MGSIQGGYNVTRSQPTVARTFKYQVSLYTSPGAGDSNSYAGRNTVTGAPHDIQCDEAASHNSETDVTRTATWYNMLEIQACSENNVSFDLDLCFLHFFEQVGVTDDSCGISDFPTGLIQTRDYPNNGPFCHVC